MSLSAIILAIVVLSQIHLMLLGSASMAIKPTSPMISHQTPPFKISQIHGLESPLKPMEIHKFHTLQLIGLLSVLMHCHLLKYSLIAFCVRP